MKITDVVNLIKEGKMTTASIVAIVISVLVGIFGPDILPRECPEANPIQLERQNEKIEDQEIEISQTLSENGESYTPPQYPDPTHEGRN